MAGNKKVEQDFSMKPLAYFGFQLSGAEWVANLPSATPEDRRMRKVVFNNCNVCHQLGLPLEKRFTQADWGLIVEHMAKMIRATDPVDRPGGVRIRSRSLLLTVNQRAWPAV